MPIHNGLDAMPTEQLAAWLERVRALQADADAAGTGGQQGGGGDVPGPQAAARPGQLAFTITRLGPPPGRSRQRRGRAGRRAG